MNVHTGGGGLGGGGLGGGGLGGLGGGGLWLDGKHTVFGRVTKGADVVHAIEKAKTDRNDKPLVDIKMLSFTTTE